MRKMFSTVFGLIFSALFSLQSVEGQFPRICVENITTTDKVCCPKLAGQPNICGGLSRGYCGAVAPFPEVVSPEYYVDDRVQWPRRFFHKGCVCEKHYFGVACEQCAYGYTGPNCRQREVLVRRNIKTYTEKERLFLRDLIYLSDHTQSDYMLLVEKDIEHSDPLVSPRFINTTVHKYFAALHRYASRSTLFRDKKECSAVPALDYNHGTTMFMIWHRYFMIVWERELRRLAWERFKVANFTIPYWDWIDAKYCEVCTNDLMGAEGEFVQDLGIWRLSKNSVFRNFTEYCQPPDDTIGHCFGCHFRQNGFEPLNRHWDKYIFPSSAELRYVFAKSVFFIPNEKDTQCDSFHKAFEGFCGPGKKSKYLWMHNKFHNVVRGSICCAATAANDPLFILHHAQIDRIFHVWYLLYHPSKAALPVGGVQPGNGRESNMVGFYPTLRNMDMFVDTVYLGYDYDSYRFGTDDINFDHIRQFTKPPPSNKK